MVGKAQNAFDFLLIHSYAGEMPYLRWPKEITRPSQISAGWLPAVQELQTQVYTL